MSSPDFETCPRCGEEHAPGLCAQEPSFLHRGIYEIGSGQIIAAAGFTSTFAVWPWVKERVSENFDCDPDDVDLDEEDEDCITVRGERVAVLERGAQVYAPCSLSQRLSRLNEIARETQA